MGVAVAVGRRVAVGVALGDGVAVAVGRAVAVGVGEGISRPSPGGTSRELGARVATATIVMKRMAMTPSTLPNNFTGHLP